MNDMRKLINLMEGVMPVPGLGQDGTGGAGGAEADMQTIGTDSRNQAYAAYDASQGSATEEVGLEEKSTSEKQARFMAAAAHDPKFAKKVGMDRGVAKEFNKADTGTKQLSNAMKHKKESSMMEELESPAQVVGGQMSNPAPAVDALAMEGMGDRSPEVMQALSDFANMTNNLFMDGSAAYDRIIQGLSDEAIEEFNDALEIEGLMSYGSDEQDDSMDGDHDSAMASADHGSDEDYGGDDFPMETDEYQFDEAKSDKYFAPADPDDEFDLVPDDVLRSIVIEDIQQFISDTLSSGEVPTDHIAYDSEFADSFDAVRASSDENLRRAYGIVGKFSEAEPRQFLKAAKAALKILGAPIDEAFDLQNGYHDINVANGNDYFPNGADSPVVRATGPSGARQGDNPEQKKMQVAEVHKELVYSYRSFLNESKR